MPTNASVKRILSAVENDNSKVLGVIVNGKEITTKQYVPRAGKLGLSQPYKIHIQANPTI